MDFLKALMVYMTMALTTSMQGETLPEATPTPTATPVAIVTPAPEDTAAATETPSVTVAGVPVVVTATPVPQPTITPNQSYKNLKQGDRGDQVKKVQERLIELGYLTGEADGAYGGQTRRAVLRFQYYNGLQQDGVAGRATQTILFEEENVVAYPGTATATPVVTETPAPAVTEAPAAEELPVPEAETDEAEAVAEAEAMVETEAEAVAVAEAEPAETEAVVALPEGYTEPATATDMDAVSYAVADTAVTLAEGATVTLDEQGLTYLSTEGNVSTSVSPRVYTDADDNVYIALDDLMAAVPAWLKTSVSDTVFTITIGDNTVTFTQVEGGYQIALNDVLTIPDAGELAADGDVLLVRTTFLRDYCLLSINYDADAKVLSITE
jgi:peptidoglycan hydrolase-like protein with peptidoglycan-binding domain